MKNNRVYKITSVNIELADNGYIVTVNDFCKSNYDSRNVKSVRTELAQVIADVIKASGHNETIKAELLETKEE